MAKILWLKRKEFEVKEKNYGPDLILRSNVSEQGGCGEQKLPPHGQTGANPRAFQVVSAYLESRRHRRHPDTSTDAHTLLNMEKKQKKNNEH